MPKLSSQVWIGIICIVASYILSWIGTSSIILVAAITGQSIFLLASAIIYIASWILFFLGIYLAGVKSTIWIRGIICKLMKKR